MSSKRDEKGKGKSEAKGESDNRPRIPRAKVDFRKQRKDENDE